MEAVRPEMDQFVLDLARNRTLRADDFVELRNGHCRLMPPLARELAHVSALCAQRLSGLVEQVAEALYSGVAPFSDRASSKRKRLPTPLTEKNRKRRFIISPKDMHERIGLLSIRNLLTNWLRPGIL